MAPADLLTDGFDRVREVVHHAVDGLSPEQLAVRPGETGNSIAWLVWHLTRIQDDHVAAVAGSPQVWTSAGWQTRFGLSLPTEDTGYGHSSRQVGAVRVASGELLTGYYDAVHAHTLDYLKGITDDDLGRVVDRSWDPPVTLATRLVSVLSDDLQHAGQAQYVRGLLPG
jgi:uncharacterized damage-inducible protein DinB